MTRNVAIKQLWVCQSSVSMASGPSHLAHFSCAAVTRCCCLPSRLQGDCGGSSHRIQTPASSTKSRLLACILFVRKALPGSPSVPSSDTATCACRNQSPAGTQACHGCLSAAPPPRGWGGAAALPLRPWPPPSPGGGGAVGGGPFSATRPASWSVARTCLLSAVLLPPSPAPCQPGVWAQTVRLLCLETLCRLFFVPTWPLTAARVAEFCSPDLCFVHRLGRVPSVKRGVGGSSSPSLWSRRLGTGSLL